MRWTQSDVGWRAFWIFLIVFREMIRILDLSDQRRKEDVISKNTSTERESIGEEFTL